MKIMEKIVNMVLTEQFQKFTQSNGTVVYGPIRSSTLSVLAYTWSDYHVGPDHLSIWSIEVLG